MKKSNSSCKNRAERITPNNGINEKGLKRDPPVWILTDSMFLD